MNLMCKEPNFRCKGYIDGYRLGAIAIFPNMDKKNAESSAAFIPILPLDTTATQHTLRLPVPMGSTHYLVCLKIEGCKSGQVNDNAPTQGMAVIGNGIWAPDKNEAERGDNDSSEGTKHEEAEDSNTM